MNTKYTSLPGRLIGVDVGTGEGHVGGWRGGGVVDGPQVWWVGVGGGVAGPAGLDQTVWSSRGGQGHQHVPVCLRAVRVVLQNNRVLSGDISVGSAHLYVAGQKS